MKMTFTKLAFACLFCFVGLPLAGCGGGGENTVVEQPDTQIEDLTEDEEDEYEKEMARMAAEQE